MADFFQSLKNNPREFLIDFPECLKCPYCPSVSPAGTWISGWLRAGHGWSSCGSFVGRSGHGASQGAALCPQPCTKPSTGGSGCFPLLPCHLDEEQGLPPCQNSGLLGQVNLTGSRNFLLNRCFISEAAWNERTFPSPACPGSSLQPLLRK